VIIRKRRNKEEVWKRRSSAGGGEQAGAGCKSWRGPCKPWLLQRLAQHGNVERDSRKSAKKLGGTANTIRLMPQCSSAAVRSRITEGKSKTLAAPP